MNRRGSGNEFETRFASPLARCYPSRLTIWTFAAVFLLVATSAFAQEKEKQLARSVSPDGKWEFRAGVAWAVAPGFPDAQETQSKGGHRD